MHWYELDVTSLSCLGAHWWPKARLYQASYWLVRVAVCGVDDIRLLSPLCFQIHCPQCGARSRRQQKDHAESRNQLQDQINCTEPGHLSSVLTSELVSETYHVYCHCLRLTKAFLCFLSKPRSWKYLQCWSGPARYPVRMRKTGTPTYGTKFNGKKMTNSKIWRKENGP